MIISLYPVEGRGERGAWGSYFFVPFSFFIVCRLIGQAFAKIPQLFPDFPSGARFVCWSRFFLSSFSAAYHVPRSSRFYFFNLTRAGFTFFSQGVGGGDG